jgi:signal transduction histidine kinase
VVALLLVFLTIRVVHYLDAITFWPLMALVAALAVSNLFYTWFVRRDLFRSSLDEIQIVVDLLILTLMLHFSGGIENPLSFVFLFHVILSGILLSKRRSYAVVILALILYATLALAELSGVVAHYTLDIFPHDGDQPHVEAVEGHTHEGNHDDIVHASHHPVYVFSMIGMMMIILSLTAYFITNIMDRVRTEEQRAHGERQRLEHVLGATGAGLLILNEDLEPVWHNEPVEEWLKLTANKARRNSDAMASWIGGRKGPAAQTVEDGKMRSVERQRITEFGQKQSFQVTIAPLTDARGKIHEVVELIQDITERKMIETEMLHAAKMVTLGTMAAGIAHEVGNPLASMSARLGRMESEREESFIAESVKLIQREIHRIERILRGISQFGRPVQQDWGFVDINRILQETLEILKYHKAAKRCRVETDLSASLPQPLGTRDQLKQVFINLGLNAIEAMQKDGGTLKIKTFAGSGEVKVQFSDTGTGLEASASEQIFQPFFTTKDSGSGLGLFMVKHIVQAHAGEVRVENGKSKGATFTVTLPVHGPHHVPER